MYLFDFSSLQVIKAEFSRTCPSFCFNCAVNSTLVGLLGLIWRVFGKRRNLWFVKATWCWKVLVEIFSPVTSCFLFGHSASTCFFWRFVPRTSNVHDFWSILTNCNSFFLRWTPNSIIFLIVYYFSRVNLRTKICAVISSHVLYVGFFICIFHPFYIWSFFTLQRSFSNLRFNL